MQLPRATRLVVRIAGERMYLWRAVDHEGEVLDMRGDPHRKIRTPSGPRAGRATE
jgi:transposase-like protein